MKHFIYAFQAYNISIKDSKQPMLVSKPKEKDRRGGRTQLLYLIPELCFMTGGTDFLCSITSLFFMSSSIYV